MESDKLNEKRAIIAFRIKAARKMAGLSQAQVATLLGIQRPSISEAEAGRRRISAEEIVLLAELYEVEASWLLGEGENSLNIEDTRLQLVARELKKLKKDDLSKILDVLGVLPRKDKS